MYNANPSVTSYLYYRDVSDTQLKTLLNYAPVGVVMYANYGFIYYSSGVYYGCPSNYVSQYYINHAVVIIGYDTNGNWIIKNQWGTSWGENGFATISKYYNCGLSLWVFQYSSTQPYSGNTDYTVTSFYSTTKQTNY
jgi:C1A family cysteine protease